MKLRIEGIVSLDEAHSVIRDALDHLKSLGVSSLSDMNFYFSVYDSNNEEVVMLGLDGGEVEFLFRGKNTAKVKKVKYQSKIKLDTKKRVQHESHSA